MIFDKFPYTNFHELNLHYFLVHFKEIFEQWHDLYTTMLAWKAATDQDLADWKTATETALEAWKTATEAAIDNWEDATIEDLETWKAAFQELFDSTFADLVEIKTAAEDARDDAIDAKDDAEAAAASVSASAAQIENNRLRSINSWGLKNTDYTNIPDNTDFNSLTTIGNYKVQTSASMQTMTNSPVTTAAYVVVEQGATSNVILQHVFASDSSGTVWYRVKLPSDWLPWRRLAPTDATLTTLNAPADAKATGDKALYAIYTNYSNTTAINSNSDLNDYTSVGNYRVSSGSVAETLSNCPSSSAGRLFVMQGTATNIIYQIYFANEDPPVCYYRAKYSSGWKKWTRNADWNNVITPGNTAISSSNVSTYFPSGKMADAPANTMYYIVNTDDFSDAPVGNGRIVTSMSDAGHMSGLLVTLSGYRNKSGVVNSYSQMFLSYRPNNSPVFAYRAATVSNGVVVYGQWSKFEQDGYLHSSNQVIYGGSLDVAPFTDLNDAPPNTIYQLDLNLDDSDAEHTLAHHPEPGVSSVVMTYAYSYSSTHGMVQTLYNLVGRFYWRYGYQNAPGDYRWTSWKLINPNVPPIPNAPSTDGTYKLRATVSNGAKSYSWVSDT